MQVRVEFYGIARQLAGRGQLELELPGRSTHLGAVLDAVAVALPALAGEWIGDGRLHATLAANLNGERFVSDPRTPVSEESCVLILSADAGG
jgi:molybdopterin converting factor small subunit